MQIPEEFKTFASLFDLALHDDSPTERELIGFALKHTPKKQKVVVRSYIDRLLKPDVSGEMLQKVWFEAGASLFIPDQAEVRTFLQMIRKELGEQ